MDLRHLLTFRGHTVAVAGVTFHPEGKLIASGENGIVRVWATATGKELTAIKGHAGLVRGLAFRPDGKFLVCHDDAGVVRIYDTATWKLHQELPAAATMPAGVMRLPPLDNQPVTSPPNLQPVPVPSSPPPAPDTPAEPPVPPKPDRELFNPRTWFSR